MATQGVAAIFVVILSLTAVDATDVRNCLGKNQESMLGVELSGCDVAPCLLKKNTTVIIEIMFKPDNEVKQLKHAVLAKVGGVAMPFVGVDGTSACNNVYQEDKTTKASCPLSPGTTYVYQYQLVILPSYPNINMLVHWALQDVARRQDVACFEISAKIVRQIIK